MPILPMMARIDVFGGDAFGALAVDDDVHGLGARLHEALGGEHVFDFAGADAESERAECAVGGGVASRRRRWFGRAA